MPALPGNDDADPPPPMDAPAAGQPPLPLYALPPAILPLHRLVPTALRGAVGRQCRVGLAAKAGADWPVRDNVAGAVQGSGESGSAVKYFTYRMH